MNREANVHEHVTKQLDNSASKAILIFLFVSVLQLETFQKSETPCPRTKLQLGTFQMP